MDISLKKIMAVLAAEFQIPSMTSEELADKILFYGGVDMEGMSREDIVALYDNNFQGDKREAIWALDETLSYYQCVESPAELLCGVFSLIVFCRLCSDNKDVYADKFNKMLDTFYCFRERLDNSSLILPLFILCFSNQPQYPEALDLFSAL